MRTEVMSDTYKAVFKLIKESLFSENEKTAIVIEDTDWNSVFREMQSQTVAALPYEWLKMNRIPDKSLQKRWLDNCLRLQGRWVQVMYAQSQMVNLLEENKTPYVIIKGTAAALYYPVPSLRMAGDVDVFVKRKDYEKAAAIFEENGFDLVHDKDKAAVHYCYKKENVSFELHNRLGIVRQTNIELITLFERGIDHRVWQTIDGVSFPVLPADLNGLVLLFHINQHLRSGLGLRQITDWMMYLNANNNLGRLMPMIQNTGMEKLALTVTMMCQKYLGLKKVVEESEQYPCDELMDYIIAKGNFGRKSGKDGKTASVFLDMATPVRVFRRLQAGGLCRWKAAKKYKILHPFAWIYQIGFISRQLYRANITPAKMISLRRTGLEQRDLIRKLGLDLDGGI